MKTTTSLFVLLIAIIFSSCGTFKDVTIEKRHHRKGYYVHVREDRAKQNEVVAENQNLQEEAATANVAEENTTPVGRFLHRQPFLQHQTARSQKKNRKLFFHR